MISMNRRHDFRRNVHQKHTCKAIKTGIRCEFQHILLIKIDRNAKQRNKKKGEKKRNNNRGELFSFVSFSIPLAMHLNVGKLVRQMQI